MNMHAARPHLVCSRRWSVAIRLGAALLCLGTIVASTGCSSPLTSASTSSSGADGQRADENAARPRVVTADIQTGIERHIEEETERGGGYFNLTFDEQELRLRLVRVHTEYLANLGPQRHFACVDLVAEDGNVYDVDFFLEGEPGDMRVTETIVHKLNGKPFYVWKQEEDRTWSRVSVDDADKPLLGVIEDEDRFRFSYEVKLPSLNGDSRMWLPLPQSDAYQTIEMVRSDTPVPWDVLEEQHHGNEVIFMTLGREHSGSTVRFLYDVHRIEKSVYPAGEEENPERYLNPERLVPDNDIFRRTAAKVLEGKVGELVRARALYDHVIDHMNYVRVGDEYGHGDAVYACDAQTGNCTDYHSYFIALARAADIPARFAIGAPVPSERNEGGINGYHCWAEFYADGEWWPIDISEGDKYTALATYYFGRHPANRIEFSRGRDLVVEPGPASGPINFLADPILEVNGRVQPIKPFLSFERAVSCNHIGHDHDHGSHSHSHDHDYDRDVVE